VYPTYAQAPTIKNDAHIVRHPCRWASFLKWSIKV